MLVLDLHLDYLGLVGAGTLLREETANLALLLKSSLGLRVAEELCESATTHRRHK